MVTLSWHALRALGNNPLAKLIPLSFIIGNLILFENTYLAGANLRLYVLYFGFVFLTISQMLFELFCPKIVKCHKDGMSFTNYATNETSKSIES